MKNIKIVTAAIAMTLAPLAAIAASPSAHAETITDAAFIATLDYEGIPYSTPHAAIAAAHAVCEGVGGGMSVVRIGHLMAANAGLTFGQSGYVIGAAIEAYCPAYDGLI
ncbi:MAG: DUF732 domain-containing protein [Candidatus Nanopelagicales bacterium]